MTTQRAFLLITLAWLGVTLYTNERVLAPEVMADVVQRTTGVETPVDQLEQLRRQGRWAYPLLPVLLAIRVGVAGLVLQLVAILMAHPLRYVEAFRAGLWGFGAVTYGTFIRMLRLDLLPAGSLTRAELLTVPDSLAVLLPGPGLKPGPATTVLSATLSTLTLHDALWIGIVTACLMRLPGLEGRRAFTIALVAWGITALARVGAQVFMASVLM